MNLAMLILFILVPGILLTGSPEPDQEGDRILFPHTLHLEELELECEQCHEGISESVSMAVRVLPEEESCLECHDGDTATDECSACHSKPESPQTYLELLPRPGPAFSHAFHLLKRPNCDVCHAYIYEDAGIAPSRSWIDRDCRACHEVTQPDNHTLDWIALHGLHASEENCMLCHSQAGCDGCHQLQQFEPKVHPVAYILSHGFDSRSGITDCASCHQVQSDCQPCHHDNQIMPMDHNMPGWVVVFDDGGGHAPAALDVPEVCIACHELESSTCKRCHGE